MTSDTTPRGTSQAQIDFSFGRIDQDRATWEQASITFPVARDASYMQVRGMAGDILTKALPAFWQFDADMPLDFSIDSVLVVDPQLALTCPLCGGEYSVDVGDYFMRRDDTPFRCGECEEPMALIEVLPKHRRIIRDTVTLADLRAMID